MKNKLLIVVHPGSTCRSADDALGEDEARQVREALAGDIRAWPGGIAVIDGTLSADLGKRKFYDLGLAIGQARMSASRRGDVSVAIRGCDFSVVRDQSWAARQLLSRHGWTPEDTEVSLSGAWYDPDDVLGCVNDVRRVFERAGFVVSIRDSAVRVLPSEPVPAGP